MKRLPDSFKCGDVTTSNPFEIANHFNMYFTNIGPNMTRELPITDVDPVIYVKGQIVEPLVLNAVNENEMSKLINVLKNTSSGYDGYQAKALKYVKDELLTALCYIVNISLEQGVFPDRLKHALVTPIYKSGERAKVENYRPISVLSVFSKIYEKVMYNRLLPNLEINNVLHKHQYGFRPGYSTDQALIHMTDTIRDAFDKKEHLVGVFMDLAKAFDSINHTILIRKLHEYGLKVDSSANKWITSYLNNRCQQVKYNGTLSDKRQVVCGVPQGSQLGPLLFLLYINDICQSSEILTFILFADDTNAYIRGKDIEQLFNILNVELAKVAKWLDANQLCLNVGKTQYMIFSNRHVNVTHDIMMKGIALECVPYTKFLGVIVDCKLHWKENIMYIRNKMSKCIAILYKVNRILSTSVKLRLYKTFIQPYLTYCNTVWGTTYPSTLKPLEIMQKRAIKMALNLPWETPSDEVFNRAKVHNICTINNIQVAIFMYKYNYQLLPKSFEGKFKSNSEIHNYNTRVSQLHHVPLIRLDRSRFSINYRGVIVWNALKDDIRNIKNLNQFKTSVKQYNFQW